MSGVVGGDISAVIAAGGDIAEAVVDGVVLRQCSVVVVFGRGLLVGDVVGRR